MLQVIAISDNKTRCSGDMSYNSLTNNDHINQRTMGYAVITATNNNMKQMTICYRGRLRGRDRDISNTKINFLPIYLY